MMLIDTMKIKEELAKYFPEPKPKNSPEITTVLASIAEELTKDEDFHNFPKEIKRFVLLKSGCLFMERFQIMWTSLSTGTLKQSLLHGDLRRAE